MLYEIVTPYDTQDCCDVHATLPSLFRKLAEMTTAHDGTELDGQSQHEITVLRWESWEQREAARADENSDTEDYEVLDIDDL